MKCARTLLTVGVTVLLLGLTPGLSQNVLDNPGFETGAMNPWYQDAGGGPENWNVTTADVHSGTYSATTVGNNRIRQDLATPVPTADIIEVSYWVKQADSGTTGTAAWYLYSDGSSEQVTEWLNDVNDWVFLDFTAGLDANKELTALGVWGYSGGGPDEDRTYIDDVKILVEQECPGDLDGDGETGQSDLGMLLADWGCTGDCDGDIDGDGETGQPDLGILLADWGCGGGGAPGPDDDRRRPSILPGPPAGGAEPVSVGEVTR